MHILKGHLSRIASGNMPR